MGKLKDIIFHDHYINKASTSNHIIYNGNTIDQNTSPPPYLKYNFPSVDPNAMLKAEVDRLSKELEQAHIQIAELERQLEQEQEKMIEI